MTCRSPGGESKDGHPWVVVMCELIHSPGFFNELHTSERKHRYVSRIIRDVFHLTGAAMCKLTKTTMALAKEELKKGGYLHC